MAPRSQPHRVEWPLTAEQAQRIDEMFEILFTDIQNVDGTGPTGLTGETGLQGPTGEEGESGSDWLIPPSGVNLPGWTVGSVIFAGPSGILAQDNANLFWDDTNNRVGIKTASPVAGLHIGGTGSIWVEGSEGGLVAGAAQGIRIATSGTAPNKVAEVFGFDYGTGLSRPLALNSPGGNVGIGTSSPTLGKLQVTGDSSVDTNAVTLVLNDIRAGSGRNFSIRSEGGDWLVRDMTAGATRMNITSVGKTVFGQAFNASFQVAIPNAAYFSGINAGGSADIGLIGITSGDLISLGPGGANILLASAGAPTTGTAGIVFADGTALATMASNTAGLYADDVGGTVEMFSINEANVVSQLTGLAIRKTADESVTSATQQADDHLTVNLAASSAYYFEIVGHWTAAAGTPGIAVQLDGTVGVSSLKADVIHYDHSADVFIIARITAFNSPVGRDDTGDNSFIIRGTIETSTAGTMFLEWAQNTADAVNATTLQENSSFTLRKLNA